MAEGKQVRRMEQMLDTIHDANRFFKLNDLFTNMQEQHSSKQTESLSIQQKIQQLSSGVSIFFAELDRKINYINIAQVETELEGTLGDVFLEKLNSEVQSNNLSMPEAYFLTNIGYFRVERHFDNGGKYHPEHRNKDDLLILLPMRYSELKKQMILPAGSGAFISEQIKRLELLLMYLQFADLDFDIDQLVDVYQRFEEEMTFCQTIPEKFQNIYHNKEGGFSGSWKKYKVFEKDKISEHYQWIEKIQEFEKTHPYIGTAIQIYVMDYNRRGIIGKTKAFEFGEDTSS